MPWASNSSGRSLYASPRYGSSGTRHRTPTSTAAETIWLLTLVRATGVWSRPLDGVADNHGRGIDVRLRFGARSTDAPSKRLHPPLEDAGGRLAYCRVR